MKKLLLFVGASLLINNIDAQQLQNPSHLIENANASKAARFSQNANNSRVSSGFIDYSWQNFNNQSYVFGFNSNFVSTDTSINYIGVALTPFKGVFDYVDNDVDFNITPYPASFTYTVDSIFASITHENNSGLSNNLTMQLVQLSGTGTLTSGATVKWSDSIVTTTSLSSGGNWLGAGASYLAQYAPNYTATVGTKLGMVIKYIAPKADSMGVLGSSINDSLGTTFTQSPFPTSFMQSPPYISTIIPCRNIGYGNPVGSGGWFQAQDWEIWAKVTFNDVTGVSDNELAKNVTLYQNIPNPANGSTLIKYDLEKTSDINLSIYDVTGRKIFEKSQNDVIAGSHKMNIDVSNFSKGAYFYTLTANGNKVTKRMVITE